MRAGQQARLEAEARKEAEEQARREAEARRAAEEQIERLQARLRGP